MRSPFNRALYSKCVQESRWLLLACAAGLAAFAWVRVWLVSRIEMSRFKVIVENFREELEKFSTIPVDQLLTYTGRTAAMYDEPIVVLCMLVWAIARGSDSISGELGRGTMEMLLAQPLSRLQVLGHQAAVTVGGVALLAALSWLATWVGLHTVTVEERVPSSLIESPWLPVPIPNPPSFRIPGLGLDIPNPNVQYKTVERPMDELVDSRLLLPGAVNYFALGVFIAGLSTLMSAWDRYRWRTIGIVVGAFVVSLCLKIMAAAVDELDWLFHFTFLTAYEPQRFVGVAIHSPDETWSLLHTTASGAVLGLGPLGYDLVLLLLGLACYLGAAVIFLKRDLPAPL